jgi:flagellar FliL protein
MSEPEVELEVTPKKKGKKKKLIIIVVLLLLVLGGGGAAVKFGGLLGKKPADGAAEADAKPVSATADTDVFHDLPDILVNLDGPSKQQHFLKMKISLELANKADEAAIDKIMPRVTDQFQTYLRELRVEDLKGSAGIYRMRQELLTRVSAASAPIEVKDVLFRELLIQ